MAPVSTTCIVSGKAFEISEEEQQFLAKMQLPLSQIAPKYREIMRLAFRNERNLYKRTCDFSGKSIISIYPASSPFKVYEYDVWISDDWTPPELEYDSDKPFFEQYQELQKITPRLSLFTIYNENSEYVNCAEKCKNCYMAFVSDRSEDCFYIDTSFACRDCADCSYSYECELCYESCDLRGCYRARWSYLCENSSNIDFCFDVKGCRNCFMCTGLRNKEYHIFNQPYSKEDYEKKMAEIRFTSNKVIEQLKQRFFSELLPHEGYTKIINCENSDGNFLINCKNCHECFDCEEAEDCTRVRVGVNGIKDVWDTHAVVDGSQLIYNNVSTTEGYNCHNVIGCWTSKESAYSEFLQGCKDCLGCISLRRKQYCILNKQYSAEEYQSIKQDIISKMGDYWGSNFPLKLAPFSYLDSAYRDYKSLTQEEVEQIGWRWADGHEEVKSEEEKGALLPDSSDEFTEQECDKVFTCSTSGRSYRVIPQELMLLKKLEVPIPRRHYDVRFRDRVTYRLQH